MIAMPCGRMPCDVTCTTEKCASNPNCKYKNGSKAEKAKLSYAEMKAAMKHSCQNCGACNDKKRDSK